MQTFEILLLHCLFLWATASATNDAPVAETDLGTIVGKFHNVTVFGQTFTIERFLGIPYAEPPIGDLRFRKPKPKTPFTEPYQATEFGDMCYQMFLIPFVKRELPASEDCLLLNIFAPVQRAEPVPVMIYIHGGGYFSGASNPFVADALAGYGEVIVVTINYRLSLWGFLGTGDEHAPGNYGFYDQHLAIKWVNDNIANFGGDPGNVTLFGESVGGSSTTLQSILPANAGFFQRAIAQSGGVDPLWRSAETARKDAHKIGRILGCTNMDSAPLVACLRNISGEVLSEVINDPVNKFARPPWPFAPSISNTSDFFYEDPTDWFKLDATNNMPLERKKFFASLDFLLGINSAEGAYKVDSLGEPNKTYFENHLVPLGIQYTLGPNIPALAKLNVLQTYTDWENPMNAQKRLYNLMGIYSDTIFGVPTLETARYHSSVSTKGTFFYLFDIKPSERVLNAPGWVEGANHADELQYLFYDDTYGLLTNLPGHEGYTPEPWESEIAKYMITMWTNFAKTGNPNSPTPLPTEWPQYALEDQQYLHITKNSTAQSVKSYLLAEEYNLWHKIIPEVYRTTKAHTCIPSSGVDKRGYQLGPLLCCVILLTLVF